MSFTPVPPGGVQGAFDAAEQSAPDHPRTTYGRGDVRIVQANVSDVKAIKGALLDPQPKPDHEGVAGALGAAGLVAYKILHPSHDWAIPSTGYEIVVLLAVCLHAYGAVRKYVKSFKAKMLTQIAIGHVNDMIAQVETIKDDKPVASWWKFLAPKKS